MPRAATPPAEPETEASGLTGLDWLVVVAATVCLVLGLAWLFGGRPPKAVKPTGSDT